MMLKVTEQSKFPDYLAFIIIYQAGQKDILAVELWQVKFHKSMSHGIIGHDPYLLESSP